MRLSRLLICDVINNNTPACVLLEIAGAHGFKFNAADVNTPGFGNLLLENILTGTITNIVVNENGKLVNLAKDLPYIARFINKEASWKGTVELFKAFNFLMSFATHEDCLNKLPQNFLVGAQTPENPQAINACVLYKICNYHRLQLNYHTTLKQMEFAVRMLIETPASLIRRSELFISKFATKNDLVNILLLSPNVIEDPKPEQSEPYDNYYQLPPSHITHDQLRELHSCLYNITSLQNRVEPSTHYGAVALAMINFNIDISRCKNPIAEYACLKLVGLREYQPQDPWMKYWYNRNSALFDLNKTFSPNFPENYYNQSNLARLGLKEGYNQSELACNSIYELLQIAYVTNTFYQGELFTLTEKETSLLREEISTVPYLELYSYGQIEGISRPITLDELIELFENNQNFNNPFDKKSLLSSLAIAKLKNLLQSAASDKHLRLLAIINSIEMFNKAKDNQTRQLITVYRNAQAENRDLIVTLLNSLLHVGLHMRGWMGGNQPYPLQKAPVDDEIAVSLKVTEAISRFENLVRSSGKIGLLISELPLVQYKDGQYCISTDSIDGRTIMERIRIVKEGENTGNVSSCIRLTSNWICASAHKYLVAIGKLAPFDITLMRSIS